MVDDDQLKIQTKILLFPSYFKDILIYIQNYYQDIFKCLTITVKYN